jgi:hypothetical protein
MRSFPFLGSSLVVLALATAASALVACSSPASEADSVSEGKATRQTRKGAEFARCWTTNDGSADPDFRVYSLICRASSAGLKGLETSSVNVDARTVKSSVQSGTPSKTLDQDLVVGRFYKSDFPLKATVYGYWKLGEFTSSDYRTEITIAETVAAEQPVVVKLPFDSWEVTLLNRLPQAAVSSERYEVQAAPFITEPSSTSTKTTFTTSAQTPFLAGIPRLDLDIIVPQTGSLTLSLAGLRTPSSIAVSGPGVFVLDTNGIRKATAAEEAEADGAGADAGPAPAVDSGSIPATDAGPAPTDAGSVPTTCGNDTQLPCKDAAGNSSCNAGTRFDANNGKCTACGNAGQTYCFVDPKNVSGNSGSSCNAGTRFDANTSKCVACGHAGETYCFVDPRNVSSNSGSSCNAGTRFDSNTSKCVACGNAGETYCFADPRNVSSSQGSTCNAGTRYDQNTGHCIACGNAGQTYCFADPKNFSGTRVCTAPATYNQNNSMCQ